MSMYVPRKIKGEFEKRTSIYSIISLVGPRQSGKTTFLKELAKGKKHSYVLFDDPDARSLFEEDIKKFANQYIEGYDVAILDEIQYCKDAGSKLKYLADTIKTKLWITSSSEILLNKNILSYLVGRVSIMRLYPFSLSEFLIAKEQKSINEKILQRYVWEHATYGGYPKVTLIKDIELKKTILRDLYSTMILKDVAANFSIEEMDSLEKLIKYFAINIGKTLVYENISSFIDLSYHSLIKYTNALEKSYFIARAPPFFTNKNKELSKQSKFYFVDVGMRNLVAGEFKQEISGEVFENYVFSELLKLNFKPKYWRTKSKAEVDFVLEQKNQIIPVEVKIQAKKITRSLYSFIELYKPKKALVICYKCKKISQNVGDCEVIFTDLLGAKEILKAI